MLSVQASSLHRIIPCKSSIKLEYPAWLDEIESDTKAAREGIAMHAVSNEVLNGRIGTAYELIDKQTNNGVYITGTFADAIMVYVNALKQRPGVGQTEANLDWIAYTPNGPVHVLCRTDHCYFDPHSSTLYIDDAKFGWRPIEPENNWTLIAYAIGWCKRHPEFKVLNVVLSIHQPFPHHELGKSRSWPIGPVELWSLQLELENHLSDLYRDDNPLVTGPYCDKCPMLTNCPAALNAGYNAVDVAQKPFNQVISNEMLPLTLDVLKQAQDHIESLISAYNEIGLYRSTQGAVFKGYMSDRRQGDRRFKAGITHEMIEALTGKPATVTKTVTPAELGRRGVSDTTLNALTERPLTDAKFVKRDITAKARKILNGR